MELEDDLISEEMSSLSNRKKTSNWKIFWKVLKMKFVTKFRTKSSLFEILFSITIPLWVFFIYEMSSETRSEILNPVIDEQHVLGYDLGIFLKATGNASFIMVPDTPTTHQLMSEILLPFQGKFDFAIQYVNTYKEMENLIYSTNINGVGIHWINSEENNSDVNPEIRVYLQTIYGDPVTDIFRLIRKALAIRKNRYTLAEMSVSYMPFARPSYKHTVDLRMSYSIFGVWSAFISCTPDFQAILQERDDKIFSLLQMMGCPESIYWACSFIIGVIVSIPSFIVLTIEMSTGVGNSVVSPSIIFFASILYVIAHMFLVLCLTTVIKKSEGGRMTLIGFLVLSVFTSFFHSLFTFSDFNTSMVPMNIMSVFPWSAMQMFLSEIYAVSRDCMRPIGWSDFYMQTKYPIYYIFGWLSFDIVLYALIFIISNAVASRGYGTPPLGWRGLFSVRAWRNLFADRSLINVAQSEHPLLDIQHLSKMYKGHSTKLAVDDVSLQIKSGEVLIIIGPNGAGKSTLINMISGAILPTSGSVSILGGAFSEDFSEIQRYLGVCFQENVFIETMTARENIELFGTCRGLSREEIEDFVGSRCEALEMGHVMNIRTKDLSGGQKRKLCIALSLLGNPPLVVMDEPAAGVDVQSRIQIWRAISALRDIAVVVTSHALDEAESVSSRIMIVARGKIPFVGTSTELRKQHQCGYVVKVDPAQKAEAALELIRKWIPESAMKQEDTIVFPVCENVPNAICDFVSNRKSIGIDSYSINVEQLEDMLIKMIQTEDVISQTESPNRFSTF